MPIIVGLVGAARTIGIPARFLPLLALFLGILGGVIYLEPSDFRQGILDGLVMGLSSIGLWSGVKNTVSRSPRR